MAISKLRSGSLTEQELVPLGRAGRSPGPGPRGGAAEFCGRPEPSRRTGTSLPTRALAAGFGHAARLRLEAKRLRRLVRAIDLKALTAVEWSLRDFVEAQHPRYLRKAATETKLGTGQQSTR